MMTEGFYLSSDVCAINLAIRGDKKVDLDFQDLR